MRRRRMPNSFLLCIERCLQSFCQIARWADAPIMEKDDARGFRFYMIVDRNDIDTRGAQRLQNRLKLCLQHHEVAIHHSLLIAPNKGGPGVDTHRISNLMSAHFGRAADGDL